MEQSTVWAHLTLCGDSFDIDLVTKEIGITPTYTRSKDELLNNGRRFGHTEWGLDTGWEVSLDINDQFSKLFLMVGDKVPVLLRLCTECNAKWYLQFGIRIVNGNAPAMYLSKEAIHFLSAINGQVDFDTFILSDCNDA